MNENQSPAKLEAEMPKIPINTPVDEDELSFFKCPECGKVHFRHAGYISMLLPYIEPKKDKELKISESDKRVMVCVNCKHSYIFTDGKIHDVTKFIDLEAWEKTEKLAHKATGPGGQC